MNKLLTALMAVAIMTPSANAQQKHPACLSGLFGGCNRQQQQPVQQQTDPALLAALAQRQQTDPAVLALLNQIATGQQQMMAYMTANCGKAAPTPVQQTPNYVIHYTVPIQAPQGVPQWIQPSQVTPQYIAPSQVTPQYIAPSQVTPQYIAPSQVTPQYVQPSLTAPQIIIPGHLPPQVILPGPSNTSPQQITPQGTTPIQQGTQQGTDGTVAPPPSNPPLPQTITPQGTTPTPQRIVPGGSVQPIKPALYYQRFTSR